MLYITYTSGLKVRWNMHPGEQLDMLLFKLSQIKG